MSDHYHRHPHHHRHLAGDLPQEVKSPPDGEIEEGEDDERQQAGQADLKPGEVCGKVNRGKYSPIFGTLPFNSV